MACAKAAELRLNLVGKIRIEGAVRRARVFHHEGDGGSVQAIAENPFNRYVEDTLRDSSFDWARRVG